MTDLPHSPAADRNKEPILAVLRTVLGAGGAMLEIASGTGQHAVFFAQAFPGWTWQPTNLEEDMLPVIAERAARAVVANVLPPLRLDVLEAQWPAPPGKPFTQRFDVIYCANMLHIAPWACCAGLMQGAARHLTPGGVLVTYGPYFEDGVPAAPGNIAFDESLRARDPAWGVRRLEDVVEQARRAGLSLRERHAMPANNLLLVFSA